MAIDFYNQSVLGSKNAPVGYYTGAKTAEELQGAEIVFFTSSFTQLKKLPEDKRNLAFAVSGGLPKEPELAWLRRISDISRKHFAIIPDYGKIVKPYLKDKDEAAYIEKYMARLDKVTPLEIIQNGMILACFEPINKFCHRHLIAKWAEDWGRTNGVQIMYGGEYFDNKRVEQPKQAAQEQTVEQPKTEAQIIVSADKRFAGIICQFTEQQIAQYADRVLAVAKTVKAKSGDGDSEFTDLVLNFSPEQIHGCADLIAQAAKQFA